jgi:hypothetical protein
MASSRPWPFDDEDRPSGSVRPLSQADLQAILAHLGDDPDQLLARTSMGRPVVAVRVRASVGWPGGSAHAAWRRMRGTERAAWARTLPWRVAVILGIGAGGGVLGSPLAPGWGCCWVGGGCGMAAARLPRLACGVVRGQPALAETSDLPGIASWRTPQPVNTGRQSVRQLKTGVGAVKDEGPAAMTRPGAADVRTQVQDAEEVP